MKTNYERIIALENITLGDCIYMYGIRKEIAVIESGEVIDFVKEDIDM